MCSFHKQATASERYLEFRKIIHFISFTSQHNHRQHMTAGEDAVIKKYRTLKLAQVIHSAQWKVI